MQWNNRCHKHSQTLCYLCTSPFWTPHPYHFWLRPPFHIHIHLRTLLDIINQSEPPITPKWMVNQNGLINVWNSTSTSSSMITRTTGHCAPNFTTLQITNIRTALDSFNQVKQEAMEAPRKAADPQLPSQFEPYQTGDKVWLEGCNLTTTHPMTKLAPRCYGPFTITCVISRTSYQLKLPPQWKIHSAHTLQRNCLEWSLSRTRPRVDWWTTGVGSGAHPKGQEKMQSTAVPSQLEGFLWCLW